MFEYKKRGKAACDLPLTREGGFGYDTIHFSTQIRRCRAISYLYNCHWAWGM